MILYHGSNVIVDSPKIIKTELGRDFGFGFYTTDIKEQAIRWAKRKSKLLNSDCGYISIFEIDDNIFQKLNFKNFPEPSLEWLDMVCNCRSNKDFTHNFDIVSGKIANDNVGETVTYVLRGIMRKEDAVERLKFEQINNQICFNTEKSLRYLKFIGFEECR